jgi:hypothetical protein
MQTLGPGRAEALRRRPRRFGLFALPYVSPCAFPMRVFAVSHLEGASTLHWHATSIALNSARESPWNTDQIAGPNEVSRFDPFPSW